MSVVFESTIKMAEGSREDWYIELKDTTSGNVEICKDVKEYSQKIEELGKEHGGIIDEVRWKKDSTVHPMVMDIIRFEMAQMQKELEEELGEPLIKEERR